MRASATILALLLVAGTMTAQEKRPDYSRDTLMRIFQAERIQTDDGRVRYRPGAVDFTALGTSWKFTYVPMLFLPLSGTDTGVTQSWPDPFSLTNTSIAMSPRAWRTIRANNRELMRIEMTERSRIQVSVTRD